MAFFGGRHIFYGLLLILSLGLSVPASGQSSQETGTPPAEDHPLLRKKKSRPTAEQVALIPVRIVELPFVVLGAATEGALNFVETNGALAKFILGPRWLATKSIALGNGTQGDGSGMGVELGLLGRLGTHQRGTELRATGAITVLDYRRYRALLRFPGILSQGSDLQFWVTHQDRPNDNFYGFGAGAPRSGRTRYKLTSLTTGTSLTYQAGPAALTGTLDYTDYSVGLGSAGISTLQAFAPIFLPGVSGPEVFRTGITLSYPRPPDSFYRGRTGEGGVAASIDAYWSASNRDHIFNRYKLTLYQTIPVLWGDRVLALRAEGVISDARSGKQVPFYLMPELGGSSNLRGWPTHRFRDRDMILFTTEYRYPLWNVGLSTGSALEAVWFADTGMVYRNLERDFSFDSLATNYGFGLRIRNYLGLIMRFNLARSSEATVFSFKAGKEF
jgi:hypothetical protein